MTIFDVILLIATGLVAGFAGGLFGIGGGVIIVPALYAVFQASGVPDDVCIKLAVGTSLATITVTSIRSVQGHHRHGNVEWSVLKGWAFPIGIGAVLGAIVARMTSAQALTLFFGISMLVLGIRKIMTTTGVRVGGTLPRRNAQRAIGVGVGAFSSLLGIGGGVIGVVLLTHFGRSLHRAIGTAAGFGLAIALPGAVAYIAAGQGHTDGVFGAAGYVSLPGFAAIAIGTGLTAPIGSLAAAKLNAVMLNRVFAVGMILTSVLMISEAL